MAKEVYFNDRENSGVFPKMGGFREDLFAEQLEAATLGGTNRNPYVDEGNLCAMLAGSDYSGMVRDFIDPETYVILTAELEGLSFIGREELLDLVIDDIHIPEGMIERMHPDGKVATDNDDFFDELPLVSKSMYPYDQHGRPKIVSIFCKHLKFKPDVEQKLNPNPKFDFFRGVKVVPVVREDGKLRRRID